MGYEYLNPDQALCVNSLLIWITLNQFAVCKWGFWHHVYFQELLSLFGLPYLVAPSEAEAQCAALNLQELTQATITDDNDVFLFGGKKVYRHFFSQTRDVEVYTSKELQQRLGQSHTQTI